VFQLRPGVARLFRLPLRSRTAIHADIDEELEALIASRVEDLVSHGVPADAARAEALRRLGASFESVRDQLHYSAEVRERQMRIRDYWDDLVQDVRYAARGLIRRPAFTAVAVLTLSIGIGATTAIFSAVNTLILRRLPYAAPEQLMSLSLTTPDSPTRKGRSDMVWSYPKFLVLRDAQSSFSDLAVYSQQQLSTTSGDIERLPMEFVGATYFRTLGIAPIRGRDFDPSLDAHPDAEKQAILSYALWQRRYNADPSVIGQTIDMNRDPYTIVGVAPEGFTGLTGQSQIFVPVTTRPGKEDLDEAQSHEFFLVARRKPGVSVGAAIAAVRVLGGRVYSAFPDGRFGNGAKWGATARPLDDVRIAPAVRRSLLILFGAVGFVLLIACVNVANLLLGRASARGREIAVRLALGAGRGRLVRLLLTESMLLAMAGGIASLFVAFAGVHALSTLDPAVTSRVARFGGVGSVTLSLVSLDWPALGFALGITAVVGLIFGLVPALGATRASVTSAMKDGARAIGSGATIWRRVLVIAEVSLAMVLLAGSGLMIRSLSKLLSIDAGFEARGLLTARVSVTPGAIPRDSMPQLYGQIVDRLRALPGVTDASLAACAPLSGGCNGTKIDFKDQAPTDFAHEPNVGVSWVTPTWFSTMRIPLKSGRTFTTADRGGAAKVVIVNETAARTFWPDGHAVGHRVGVYQGGFQDGAEVVGVVGDIRQYADSVPKPDVFLPYMQSPSGRMMIFVRTAGDAASLGGDVRRAIHDVAPAFPMYDLQTMSARAALATAQARFSAALLALFAATALSLAVIGIYGVMSLAVASRTREIGILIALGADQGRVRRSVVGEGLGLVAVGAAIGLGGALLCTRVLQTMLFDLAPSDPVTYVGIIAILGSAAAAASWIPARRAARVDPVIALRAD
jgi:putative ABC transport system permease protein